MPWKKGCDGADSWVNPELEKYYKNLLAGKIPCPFKVTHTACDEEWHLTRVRAADGSMIDKQVVTKSKVLATAHHPLRRSTLFFKKQ